MTESQERQILKRLIPKFIELETSTYCNRRCFWCPNSKYKRGQQKKFMSFNLFLKIIDDLKKIGYSGQLALHNYNEPLLDPSLYRYLKLIRIKLPKVHVTIITNGDYLTKSVLKKLEDNNVSLVCVSLHRAIGNDNYKKNLSESLKKIGKEDCKFKDVSDTFGRKYQVKQSGMKVLYYIPELKAMTSRGGIMKNFDKGKKHNFCFLPFTSGAIDYQGNMKVCCEIYPANRLHKRIGIIGNLKNESFIDLWLSNKYNLLRKGFLLNNIKNKLCLNCVKNNININNIKISVWKKFLFG